MILVLLGDPVAHSRSPAIHQAALDHLGIAGAYTARRVGSDGFREAVTELRSGELDGANVTMPHKHLAAEVADRLHPVAARAAAVNTLVTCDGDVVGELTDVEGIRYAWRQAGIPDEAPALVLGAGGAAAAALLAREGHELYLSARRRAPAEELVDRLAVEATLIPWETPVPAAVVINATPLGMRGESLPDGLLQVAGGLLDLVYGDEPTPAVRAAQRIGLTLATGEEMLLGQALVSFELWTGVAAPERVMRAALRDH